MEFLLSQDGKSIGYWPVDGGMPVWFPLDSYQGRELVKEMEAEASAQSL